MTVKESKIKGAGMVLFLEIPLCINQCVGTIIGLDIPVFQGKYSYSYETCNFRIITSICGIHINPPKSKKISIFWVSHEE